MAGACAPPCRHGTCLPVLPLDAWTSGTSPRSRPGPFPLPLALPPPWFSLPRAHPSAAVAIARRCHGHRPPLASLTCFRAPPQPPPPPRRATNLRTPCVAAIATVFLLGLRRPPPSIRRHQVLPDPAVLLCVIAVSSAAVPLSSPSRSRAVAPLPTTAEASRRRPCRRRRLGPPPPKPSLPSRSWCHEGAAEPLRWPPRAPQPDPARARTPAAAPSFAPASSGLPRYFHLPYQMRESPGYAPVLSDAVPVACGADSAASRGRRRRAPVA